MRAFILSKTLQHYTLQLVLEKLDGIAKSNTVTESKLELAEKIIGNIRYITQLYNPTLICTTILEKNIPKWHPQIRDNFVNTMSELFIDNSVHTG